MKNAITELITMFLTLAGGITVLSIILTVSAIWSGYVLSILWTWFIVKIFGLPILSIPLAIGLSLIINYLTYTDVKLSEEGFVRSLTISVLKPLMALLVGWIVKQFI